MSPIGRIFIVLNLILAAAFLGWASNALQKAEDWKDQLAAEKKAHADAVAAKEQELSDMTIQLNDVTEQQRQFREQKSSLEAERDSLKTQLDEAKRANDQMQSNLTEIQSTLGDYNDSIQQLTQQKDAAVERAHEAERARDAAESEKDAAVMAQRDAEEATNNAQLRIGDLESQTRDLLAQVDTLETRLAMVVQKTGINLAEIVAQKPIDAYVLDVNRDLKLVVINKGRKDDVKAGYTFDIYRGSQFKGQVRIQNVQESLSSGLILNEKSAIATGDSATTTL